MLKLVLQNTILGGSKEYPLGEGRFFIGRESADATDDIVIDIPVPSRFADERQAELSIQGQRFALTNLGVNPTVIDGVAMAYAEERQLDINGQFQIGEYIAILQAGGTGSTGDDVDVRSEKLIELESGIHNDLLDMMDLRRNASNVDLEDSRTRERIGDCLTGLVNQGIQSLDMDASEFLIEQSLLRRLNSIIAAADETSDVETKMTRRHSEFENSFFENSLLELCHRMLKAVGVTLQKKHMRADCDKLDSGFAGIVADVKYELSEGLREYLKSSHIKTNILDLIFGLGPLEDFLEAPSISEIMVINKDLIFVEKFGIIESTKRAFYSDRALMAVLEKVVAPVGRRLDQSNPYVDARLPKGSRVNAIIPPLAVKGPCVTIRKFSETPITMRNLVEFGALDEQMYSLFKACVENHLNIVVSGGTGSGKTTMLNCLSAFIGETERVITVEDTAELQLKQKHVVTLESRAANMEGEGAVTIEHLVKNALRMRPDRVVVGECRGGETLDMLQAMNTGHDGSMTTAHANSPIDMMKRLETMVLQGGVEMPVSAIRAQIVAAVDVVIQLNRLSSGDRKVTRVSEVVGLDEDTGNIIVEDIFAYREVSGRKGYHAYTGYLPSFLGPMISRGALDPDLLFNPSVAKQSLSTPSLAEGG